jgi:25S rRNA (uracil2634-N3)-methyltransferase
MTHSTPHAYVSSSPRAHSVAVICDLGLKTQQLISRSLDLGILHEIPQLKQIDTELVWLFKQVTAAFDFVSTIAKGRTLLVGEGNLSFALSLAGMELINPRQLTATTYETTNELSEAAQENANTLRYAGARVLHGIDATKLPATFGRERFDTIVFQFPNVASREPVEGHNPNFILVRDFLISAAAQLASGGQVLISAVDSPHYRGAFQFEEAAALAGFQEPLSYPFDPAAFSGYEHIMTHEDGSALDNHDAFATWLFRME